MAVLSKGQTFADGDDVTHTKLNNLVDAATFVAGASGTTDNSTLEVNGSGRLQVKDSGITTGKIGASAVTTAKIASSTGASDGVTFAKIQHLSDMTVIGNVSGGATVPAEVSILDEDTMSSDSATSLATQQSIKAYVDRFIGNGYVHVREEQTSGTGGGTFTSGAWRTRVLNTESTNTISGASLSSNQVTLPAGTYQVYAHAPYGKGNGTSVAKHQLRLRDTTGSTTLITGASHETPLDAMTHHALLIGRFTIGTSSAIELQHYTNTTGVFGKAGSITTEVYAELEIQRVG